MLKNLIDFLVRVFGWEKKPSYKPTDAITKTSQDGINLIKHFEGLRTKAYKDPVGIWTIGYGDTGPDVVEGLVITETEAEQRLKNRLSREFEPGVFGSLKRRPSQNEFDAMVSLAYNIGVGAFARSTLVKMFNEGNVTGAADQFLRWNKAGGKELKGLTRRRYAERAMFNGADFQESLAAGEAAL